MRYVWQDPHRPPVGRRSARPSTASVAAALTVVLLVAGLLALPGCGGGASSRKTAEVSSVRHLPVDGLEGVVTRSGVAFDTDVTHDGNGSLRVRTEEPTTVRLYELEGVAVDEARLIYRALLRTEDMDGKAYLEMLCRFPGQGEFFSRALHQPLTGSVDWTSQETPFFLKKGQIPDLVKLNLVVEGAGTVWVDEIEVLKSAL